MKKALFLFAALTMAFAMNAQVSVQNGPKKQESSFTSNAQQTKHKNSIYLAADFYMIPNEFKYLFNSYCNDVKTVKKIKPSFGVFYNRLIWKDLGIGLGYSFMNIGYSVTYLDPNIGDKIEYTEQTHALLFSVNYKFAIKAFNITPYISAGPAFTRFIKSSYTTDFHNVFMLSPGVKLGYDISRWTIFMSYNYEYYKCKIQDSEAFPKEFKHHCFKLGAGWSF